MVAIETLPLRDRALPNEPFFGKLLGLLQLGDDHVAIDDPYSGIKASMSRFLNDVLATRAAIRRAAPAEMLDQHGMVYEQKPYILLLAPCSYRYFVGFFAILALGAAVVPLSASVSVDEATRFKNKSEASCLVFAADLESKALDIQQSTSLCLVPISFAADTTDGERTCNIDITINESLTIEPTRPSLVLGTSGSTGPPKGVVLTRGFFNIPMPDGGPDDVFITMITAMNWIGGVWPPTKLLLNGVRIEIFDSQPSRPEVAWKRLRQGGVTFLMAHSNVWMSMMKYYVNELSRLSPAELEPYRHGARDVKLAMAGAIPIFPPVLKFWREIFGHPLMNLYSAAEMGGCGLRTAADVEEDVERSVGTPYGQLEVKLSEGDRGEFLIKGPTVVSHYLGDPKATEDVFDSEGFYKTGDRGHIANGVYIIDGRLKHDCKYPHHAYKVPIPELEMQLLRLHYVDEAYAVPAPEASVGEHIAVLVRLKPEAEGEGLTLAKLREDLVSGSTLPVGYLPTVLRVLGRGETVPRSYTDKPLRRQIVTEFFLGPGGTVEQGNLSIEVWESKGIPSARDFDQGSDQRLTTA
ncbi:Acyl-activating enzyme 13 [Trichophyton interdigitale]|nr:Acyl-activating enzyme 13 [Trichophyton interdigitale]KAG5218775.1 Acyl-activating enzyme 13 [Trichophyton interdigitale]KAG8212302.1 Acyl-activating enzyme 13 [Trichophyton interdigitale]